MDATDNTPDSATAADLYQDREPTLFNSLLIQFFVATALFLALLYRQNDLALLSMLVLLIFGGTKIWGKASLANVSCAIRVDKQRVFPGETLLLAATIRNAKFLPVWVHMRWPRSSAFKALGEEPVSTKGVSLLWHQQAGYIRKHVALRRGYYPMGPSHIRTGDLFGFFKSGKTLGVTAPIVVYPKKIALKPLKMPRYDLFGSPGNQSPVKDPIYILGTRDYQPARPSRYIHWKASARHLRLQEKVFEPSQQGKIMLALDAGGFEGEGLGDAFERTLEVMASLALQLDEAGFAVGLMTNCRCKGGDYSIVPSGRGPRQLADILESMARIEMKQTTGLESALKKIPGSMHGNSCALFCCRENMGTDAMRRLCKKRHMHLSLFAWSPGGDDPEAQPTGPADTISIESMLYRTGGPV